MFFLLSLSWGDARGAGMVHNEGGSRQTTKLKQCIDEANPTMDYAKKFNEGLLYAAFLEKYATDEQRRRWDAVHTEVRLSEPQRELLRGFRREMRVLVVAGAWCGDCVNQCPIFEHFATGSDRIQIRYFDRDDEEELAETLSICGGKRVPSLLFLSEDGYECGRYGDRTLAKYRQVASDQLGSACPTGLVQPGASLLAQVTQEWLNEFERIQLMLRTSARLRQLHGD